MTTIADGEIGGDVRTKLNAALVITDLLASASAFGATLVDDANAAAARTTLGMSANGSSLVSAADYAAMRALLDLEVGIDFDALTSFIRLDADYILADSTSAQKLFNTTTNGALTLTTGVYEFQGQFYIQSMSGTSGNGTFDVLGAGTATLAGQLFHIVGRDNTVTGTAGAQGGSGASLANATPTEVVTAGTAQSVYFTVRGMFKCTGAGTMIPSFALTTGGVTPAVKEGSWFEVKRLAANGTNSLGAWS